MTGSWLFFQDVAQGFDVIHTGCLNVQNEQVCQVEFDPGDRHAGIVNDIHFAACV